MRIAVIGSHSFSDYSLLTSTLDKIPDIETIISGSTPNIDILVNNYAALRGIHIVEYKDEFLKERMSRLLQNRTIIDYAEMVIIFVDLYLRNADYLIKYSQQRGKILTLIQMAR
jgi:hypothetical protein